MSLFIDTSVWSLAFRRDPPDTAAEVAKLQQSLEAGDTVITTGLVLQELLQGFSGPKARILILEHFAAVPLLSPDREDYIEAASLRNTCRRAGVQIGTIDALIGQLCIRHSLTLLSTDGDFANMAKHSELKVWQSGV